MFDISKEMDFCYGHRVWSQQLNTEFSLDGCLACRHLHGHQGKITVHLDSETLTHGMVTDFKHLNWFKKWIDDTLDHRFIIDRNDPLFTTLLPHYPAYNGEAYHMDLRYYDYNEMGDCWSPKAFYTHPTLGDMINANTGEPTKLSQAQKEMYEGYIIVPFVPTSENLSKWLFGIVSEKMKQINVTVSKVTFNETPKSQSTYYENL